MVRGSSTWMSCPAGSPLGEASQFPSASQVAITQNGDARSHAICSGCSDGRTLFAARAEGYPPSTSCSSCSEVISVPRARVPGVSVTSKSASQPGERLDRRLLREQCRGPDDLAVRLADDLFVLAIVV